MTIPQSLTREEALRQIAELQRHVDSLPAHNHPPVIKEGMLFRHACGLCIVHTNVDDDKFMLVFIDGQAWKEYRGFDGDENEFTYLGHAKDLLVLKTDKPEVVVTDEMVTAFGEAMNKHAHFPWREAVRVSITIALNGKL